MPTVTFDFDDTLTLTAPCEEWGSVHVGPHLENIALLKRLESEGNTIYIVTSRVAAGEAGPIPTPHPCVAECSSHPPGSMDREVVVEDFVREHGLPVEGVEFTDTKLKAMTLFLLGSARHYDDCEEEIAALPEGIEGVLVPCPYWDDFGGFSKA